MVLLQTKGNLTKHMKSKVHQRKCFEIGIIPIPMTADESQLDADMLVHHVEIQEDGKVLFNFFYCNIASSYRCTAIQ